MPEPISPRSWSRGTTRNWWLNSRAITSTWRAESSEFAGDLFRVHNTLGRADGLERRRVHAARQFASIHRDELVDAELHSGEHHAAVARTRAPADGFRFQHNDLRTAFGQRERGGESCETGADDGDVSAFRQWQRRGAGHLNRGKPVVEFLGNFV